MPDPTACPVCGAVADLDQDAHTIYATCTSCGSLEVYEVEPTTRGLLNDAYRRRD